MKRMTVKKIAAGLSSAFVMVSAMPLSSASAALAVGETSSDTLYGDADCDGQLLLNDAVLIMQAIGNPDAYGLNGSEPSHITKQGMLNADVYENGSNLTNMDALAIQKFLLNLIPELPEN